MNKAPIFIVGSPRSGTHLVRYCLSQHSNISICFETSFFRKIYGNRSLIKNKNIKNNSKNIVKELFNSGDPSAKEYFDLKEFLEKEITLVENYKELADLIFQTFAKYKKKSRWGEKTPFHILYVKGILKLYKNAKIIYVNRDPKNVIASYMKSTHMPDDFRQAVASYFLCKSQSERYSDVIFTIQYEELTHYPEKVLGEVCDFIGEKFENSMLTPGMVDSSYKNEIMSFDKNIQIIPEDEFKWKSVLNDKQIEIIDYFDGKKSFQLNYLTIIVAVYIQQLKFKISTYKNKLGYIGLFRKEYF